MNWHDWERPDHPERPLLAARYGLARELVSGCVLDWACGHGIGTSLLLASRATSIHALDVKPDHLAAAREHVTDPCVTFALGDLECTAMPGADWLVCCETLEHLVDPWMFLLRAQTHVRQGIVLSVPISPTRERAERAWAAYVAAHPGKALIDTHHRHDITRADIETRFAHPPWRCLHASTDSSQGVTYLLTAYAKE